MKIFLALILGFVLVLGPAAPAADATNTGCVIDVVGVKVCGTLLGQPLPPVVTTTVTLPAPPPVVVPGPTKTVTIFPQPQGPRTIFVPGPTRYVVAPGPTSTATVTAAGTPNAGPTQTVTQTVTSTATQTIGQKPVPSATVKPHQEQPFFHLPQVSLSKPEAVGYSLLGILAVAGLILLGLWLGYILGYSDADRKERNFLEALRDQFYYSGKHS